MRWTKLANRFHFSKFSNIGEKFAVERVINQMASRSLSGSGEYVPKKCEVVKTPAEKVSDILYWFLRSAIVLNVVALFFPSFNPARLSEGISKNLSLFSCGVSYDSIVVNMKRALKQGWVSEDAFALIFYASLIIIIAVVIIAASGCLSLGSHKMKKVGLAVTLGGGVVEAVGLAALFQAHSEIVETTLPNKVDKILLLNAEGVADPDYLPPAFILFIVLISIIILISIVNLFLVPRSMMGEGFSMEPKFQLFLMMLPVIALAFVFSYLPLYGWRYAFFDYKSGETLSMDKFVGFDHFTELFRIPATRRDILTVLKNTLAMSGLGIATSWIPMVFAIFLSEIKNSRFKRIVQTFTTIPNFISWVLVYAIAIAIFNTDGFINTLINSMGGSATENYLMSDSHMWLKMLAWGIWKGTGWSAIIYIAAISGIDQGLYEAATVDGAGRFAKMWYITVPELIPTFCVLLLMSIANILSNGMEQYLVFSNAMNREKIQVLDLYVYNLGLGSGLIPLSTVIGMVKSVISVILLFAANGVSKLIRGESIV